MEYCAVPDLYAFGVPRGKLPNPGRLVGTVSAHANTFELDDHGFALNDAITFRAELGGSLPSPIQAGVTYYAIPVTESTFSVALTSGGTAIDLNASASGVLVIDPDPRAAAIAWASSIVADKIPAAALPLATIPTIIRITTAELAAAKLGYQQNAVTKSLTEMVDAAHKRMDRWAQGVPIRGENVPEPGQLSQVAIAPVTDTRGWRRFGGIC